MSEKPNLSLDDAMKHLASNDQSHAGVSQTIAGQEIEAVEAGLPEAGDQEVLETVEGEFDPFAEVEPEVEVEPESEPVSPPKGKGKSK